LLLCIVILPQSPFRPGDYRLRRGPGFLSEDIRDHNRIGINAVDDVLRRIDVEDPQFVTPFADGRHRSRVRHFQALALLQFPEQVLLAAQESVFGVAQMPPNLAHQEFVGIRGTAPPPSAPDASPIP